MFVVIVLYPIKGLLKIKNANLEVLYTANIKNKSSGRKERGVNILLWKVAPAKITRRSVYMPQWK